MESLNSARIELLNDSNYAIWSMKMEALLDAKQLYDEVILEDEPVKAEGENDVTYQNRLSNWTKKNKEAFGLIVLSLTAEQAIIYRGIKKAKEIWESIKIRYEGASEDKKMDLVLELTKLKKMQSESIEEYLTGGQGLSQQIVQLGKQVTERELVRYIIEGLPEKYEPVVIALSTNRNISFVDLRQTLLTFEKKQKERRTDKFKVYRAHEKYAPRKICYVCNKPGHVQKDCWFKKENKFARKENSRPQMKITNKWNNKKEHANVIEEKAKPKYSTESALTTKEQERSFTDEEWQLDSACTSHMTCDENWMINKKEEHKIVNIAEEGRNIDAISQGDIRATTIIEGETKSVRLKNVLHVPQLRGNLMSVPSIVKKGNEVILNSQGAYIYDEDGNLICQGEFTENMFVVKLMPREDENMEKESCFATNGSLIELWHKRLGHPNEKYMKMLYAGNMVRGLDKLDGKLDICESCVLGKMQRNPYIQTDENMTKQPLECLHMDLCGPMQVPTLGGKRYIMVVVDQFTRRYFVELLKTKDETCDKLKNLIIRCENELNLRVKRIRSDNGSEFINQNMKDYLNSKGIKHQKTVFYSPRSNGMAERANRTLLDKARTLLIDSQLPIVFWGEAVSTAAYLHNITPTKQKHDYTPMELWKNKKPSVRHLKPFGCLAFYKVDNVRRHKLQAKARRGILVGYSKERRAFRIYDMEDEKIHECSDVRFDERKRGYEKTPPLKKKKTYTEIEYTIGEDREEEKIDNVSDENEASQVENDETPENPTDDSDETPPKNEGRPRRNITMPRRYDDFQVYLTYDATPLTYEDAMKTNDKHLWEEAMDKEINSMISHDVWKPVQRPKHAKVIKSKWIFKVKNNQGENEYKARLVAAGHSQKQGIDYQENFSPVMKWDSFRILLTIASQRNSQIKFYDVKTAYLNGDLDETVYMEQPPGYNTDKDKVYLIKKSIYGLPQSGRCWYKKFKEILEKSHLHALKSDPYIYVKTEEEEYLYIGVYVDDFLVISSSGSIESQVIDEVRKYIEVKETTETNMFLGVKVEQKENEVNLSQKEYVNRILCKYNMENCKPVKTPGAAGENLDVFEDSRKIPTCDYQEAMGSLMYLATGTRPDIAFTISKLSQYNNDPREIHWIAMKRVLRYLKGTEDYQLKLRGEDGKININSDASWSTTTDAKSFGGHTIQIGNSLIGWKSGKQKIVALSTMEAEFIAACDAVSAGIWTNSLLEEIEEKQQPNQVFLNTDSEALISWMKNPKVSIRTRHINRKFYFVKDEIERGNFVIQYKNTKDLEADMMTKNLNQEILKKHSVSLGLEPG